MAAPSRPSSGLDTTARLPLVADSYGKGQVRLTQVQRGDDGTHQVRQMSVDVLLSGAFAESYTVGDNGSVVATDSMKNTVYVLARRHPIQSIEEFAESLVKHFLGTYEQVSAAEVRIRQNRWNRLDLNGQPHAFAFASGGGELSTCEYAQRRGGKGRLESGLDGLLVLKTTGSAFSGFLRDEYTTLPETEDRLFSTVIKADWTWAETPGAGEFEALRERIRVVFLEVFALHDSPSVQQTLYLMGQRILEELPQIESITLELPNKHHLPVNLAPFGLDNPNMVFQPVDEPFGLIRGTVARSK